MRLSFNNLQSHVSFLEGLNVEHSKDSLLSHLVETSILLKKWNRSEACVLAGLYHSIYNTQFNENLITNTPKRKEIVERIGTDAEELVHAFSILDRQSLVELIIKQDYSVYNKKFVSDLVHIIIANWFEQLPRTPKENRFLEKNKLLTYFKILNLDVKKEIENQINSIDADN